MRPISFSIEKEIPGSLARAGILHTPHGEVNTPAFVAVATKANLKGIPSVHFKELGVQTIIANTYHLYLSGLDAVEKAGGVGKFMGFSGPTMTDSGGFQVFSLGVGFGKKISKFLPEQKDPTKGRDEREPNSLLQDFSAPAVWDEDLATSHGKLAIIDEEGVSFTSHLDGTFHRFTPERSVEIQHRLGADIIYAFDECTAPTADYDYQKEAADRTHRWAARSLKSHRGNIDKNNTQGIYGIVQGGRFEDLRIESAKTIAAMDFDGFGIGGSFSKHDILGILDKVNRELPKEKPRHLLGIGEPEDIFIGVESGIDTFDCVLPTRNGRNGGIYTSRGKIQIPNAEFREDFSSLDKDCECIVCKNYTRAYVHHLFRTHEMLGPILASMHNVYFLTNLTERIRLSILDDTFKVFRDDFLRCYQSK
ncbi:MAG: queuine tRNA-ribosyltransferase (TGT) [Parcubacteria group bacterium Gr01-1014_56]|nr:MAG: queuine tRNA-ribosyltransferase (TGT) [Parcubacteria group bacterium Gr01-1014_56]